MNSELLATCNAIGYLEDKEYFKEPDCLDNIKCLIKYLHNEDSTRDIRVQLGAAQIVQNDLIPILSQYSSENDLFHTTLRLVINLTQPALLCFGGKIPKDSVMHHHFLNVVSHSQAYKEAFGYHEVVWKVFAQKVYDILETDWEDRKPEDGLILERFLILLRNLLHVPPTAEDNNKTSETVSTHDRLLWQLHQAGIDSLLLYMSASNTEQEWCLHLAEIICLCLKEQKAEELAKAGTQRSEAERQREGDELFQMRKAEEAKRRLSHSKLSPWHSRFGGTYVARGTTALNDERDVILHKSVQQCDKVSFDEGKTIRSKPRNRRALGDSTTTRRSTAAIRKMLKDFCAKFLESGYNMLMRSVRDRMTREKAQDHDETYYLWSMSFFVEFNRLTDFRVELVSETLQRSILHFLDVQMVNYFELMQTDKHEAASWGRRLHLALKCYHEFLMTVHTMGISKNPELKESAGVLLNNIFYTVEHREIFLTLLRKFDERKQTRSYLKDLVRSTHLFLKMFENYSKEKTVMVEKKVRAKSRKPKKKKNPINAERKTFSEEEKASKWGEIQTTVTNVIEASSTLETPALQASEVFDPTSELTEEVQQQRALFKIQQHLLAGECESAAGILRTARDVWPEKNIFGTTNSRTDQELSTLHEICLADLTDVSVPPEEPPVAADEEQEEDEEVEQEEEIESAPQRTTEIEFNFQEFLKKFADARIVAPYVKLLQEFERNDAHTNHCLTKMFYRVGFTLKMYGLLFQASLFLTFQKIFNAARTNKAYKELASLAKWIVGKFTEVSLKNSCIFAEMLFWKNSPAEIYELTEGYGSFSSNKKRNRVTWSEEENHELLNLYNRYKDADGDTVDAILANLTDESRTRRQVCNQLVELGLVDSVANLKRAKGSKSAVWREDDVDELKRLHEEYAGSDNPIGNILQMMSNKKSRPKVVEKLISLGLVTDRKQLYKKRTKKPRSGHNAEIVHVGAADSDSDDNSNPRDRSEDESESSDDDDEVSDIGKKMTKLAADCFAQGFNEQVSWVRENLQNALEDRNDSSSSEPAPLALVPLTEEQENAIDNRVFKKLLKAIGVQPPSNEQEMFWRIPSSLDVGQFRRAIEALATPRKRKRSTGDSDSDGEVQVTGATEKRKKRAVISDDEDESGAEAIE